MSPVMLRRFLHDRRRWLIGWSLGIAGYAVLNVAFYPSIRDQAQSLNEVYDSMPESVRALFGVGSDLDPMSPLGYLSSQLYALAFPLLLLIAAIGVAGSLAGEEEHGLLETTYSLPVSRRRVLVERLGAVAALLAVLCAVAFVATELSAMAVDLQAGTGAVVWASVALAVLALTVAAFGVAVGALSGRRAVAVATTSGVAVASYLITSLGDANISVFKTLRPLSIFTHYDVQDILRDGRPSWSLLVLAGVAAVSVIVALVGLDRRDLRNA